MDSVWETSNAIRAPIIVWPTGYYCRLCDTTIIFPVGDGGAITCTRCDGGSIERLAVQPVSGSNGSEHGGLLALLSMLPCYEREARFGVAPLFFSGNLNHYDWQPSHSESILDSLGTYHEPTEAQPLSAAEIAGLRKVQVSTAQVSNGLKCPICLDTFVLALTVNKLDCGHTFHSDCISEWLSLHPTCPTCRETVVGDPVNFALSSDDEESSDQTLAADSDVDDGTDAEELGAVGGAEAQTPAGARAHTPQSTPPDEHATSAQRPQYYFLRSHARQQRK